MFKITSNLFGAFSEILPSSTGSKSSILDGAVVSISYGYSTCESTVASCTLAQHPQSFFFPEPCLCVLSQHPYRMLLQSSLIKFVMLSFRGGQLSLHQRKADGKSALWIVGRTSCTTCFCFLHVSLPCMSGICPVVRYTIRVVV